MNNEYKRQELIAGKTLEQEHLTNIENALVAGSKHRASGQVNSPEGAHNLRYMGRALQTKVNGVWTPVLTQPGVYGVAINLANSNPETAVTYINDAAGMTPGLGWLEHPLFKSIRPCLFKAGEVVGYLNPDNFAQFEDGTPADITSGEAGDVMIEIPKMGYRIAKAGTTLTVQITNDPAKEGFSYLAHTRQIEGDRDKLYVGAFLGSSKDAQLRSLAYVEPKYDDIISGFRTEAKANGTGYDLLSFYPVTLLQCLYLIMYKNLNSQEALGMGFVGDIYWEFLSKETGETVDRGMCSGSSDPRVPMKFLGIESLWGNLYQWIEGLVSTTDYHALTATDNFNDSGLGYTDLGEQSRVGAGWYMTRPVGNNELGFILADGGGSSSTYFGDQCFFDRSCVPTLGGGDLGAAGIFALELSLEPIYCNVNSGGRLMYL